MSSMTEMQDIKLAVQAAVKLTVKLAVDGAVARLERVPDGVASEESFDPDECGYSNESYDADELHFSDEDEDQNLDGF